ncbi:PEGA domain-containing protein [Myxococcota bacterium]
MLTLAGGTALLASRAQFGTAGSTVSTQPAPKLVQVRIAVTPLNAIVSVDDQTLPSNPATLRVPHDPSQHVVRAAAPGYRSTSTMVRFDRDQSLEIAMQKDQEEDQEAPAPSVAAPTVVQPARPILRRPAPVTPQPPPRPVGDACDPPYYLKNGIKVFKRGCF